MNILPGYHSSLYRKLSSSKYIDYYSITGVAAYILYYNRCPCSLMLVH